MINIVYPLAQVLEIKERRVEKQEKVVKEKEEELQKEQEKLKEREAERDKTIRHLEDKINQMFEEFEKGTTSPKILQFRAYIKVVKERVKVAEKKVEEQKEQVKIAEQHLAEAQEELKKKRNEVDKIKSHREGWEKEMRRELEIIEGREMDEIGNISYLVQQRQSKMLKK